MFRDLTTSKGIPLANWDKGTYDQVSEFLQSEFGIPKDWFYDLNSYDASERVIGATGVMGVALCWNRTDSENVAGLVGSMGTSAAISANPLLLVVTVVALANAFQKVRIAGRSGDFIGGKVRGTIGSLRSLRRRTISEGVRTREYCCGPVQESAAAPLWPQ